MSDTFDEPPDDNEEYESLDEALDEEDILDPLDGPQGQRDLDSQLIVDRTELEEAGADLDDPERISLLDGGIDDPDGSGPDRSRPDPDTGWDVDPAAGARDAGIDEDGITDDERLDVPPTEDDERLELIDTDATDLGEIPDDAPGSDSARW
jgi:hypothetical protein